MGVFISCVVGHARAGDTGCIKTSSARGMIPTDREQSRSMSTSKASMGSHPGTIVTTSEIYQVGLVGCGPSSVVPSPVLHSRLAVSHPTRKRKRNAGDASMVLG